MNQAVRNTNIVHESEVQRQYSRVRIPAIVTIDDHEYKVQDLSAGGFSLDNRSNKLAENKLYKGQLSIKIDGFDFCYPIGFNSLNQQPNGNIGCTFQDVDKRFSSAIRYIITAFLSGELLSTGDVINTLSRENHTDSRNKKQLQAASKSERIKSILGSLLFLGIGISALTFVALKLFGIYFVSSSQSARVVADTYTLEMPASGVLEPLLRDGVTAVTKGQLLATFSGVSLDVNIKNLPLETQNILANSLASINGSGSISSPCDCQILSVYGIHGQFLPKGAPAFTLAAMNTPVYISASFSFKDAESLVLGQTVALKNLGDVTGNFFDGKVTSMTVSAEGKDVTVLIETDHTLDFTDLNKPIKVIASSDFAQTYLNSWL